MNFGSMHFNSINLKYLGRFTLKCNVSQFQLATKKPSDKKFCLTYWIVETAQDFLIKLDIKPLMHILEISIFSLYNDLLRLTKIMNNLVKDLKILRFEVIFKCLKLVKSFQKKFCEEYLIRRPTYISEIL